MKWEERCSKDLTFERKNEHPCSFLFIFHIFTQQLLLRKRTSVIEDPISFYYKLDVIVRIDDK